MASPRPAPGELAQRGTVESLHLHVGRSMPMVTVQAATLVAGSGIPGDDKAGLPIPGSNITLIAAEGIEAMASETGIALAPGETRRNVVTRDVDLDALIGRRFRVGTAICRGVKPCNPCNHLEEVTRPGVRAGLGGRGGLRADVVGGGLVRPGDIIEVLADGAPTGGGLMPGRGGGL